MIEILLGTMFRKLHKSLIIIIISNYNLKFNSGILKGFIMKICEFEYAYNMQILLFLQIPYLTAWL